MKRTRRPNSFDEHDGQDGTERKLIGFPEPSLAECPITFLGYFSEMLVFAMPEGDIRIEKADTIPRKLKVDLFSSYAGIEYRNNWRDADDNFQRDMMAEWFCRQARAAGFWDNSRSQLAPGVWPGASKAVILHCGDEIWIYPADPNLPIARHSIAEALRDLDGPIWKKTAARPRPDTPSSLKDGRWLRETLNGWNFEPIGDDGLTGADVLMGWIGASMLGAVAPFRPHLLLFALFGSGKTTLLQFTQAALSGIAGEVLDAFTPAGLANDLAGMARPVLIDEAEASANPFGVGPIEAALGLIRRMATGTGAVKKMGTIGGGSLTQTAVGAVMMAAVNPVSLGPADASRIAEVRLLPLGAPAGPGEIFRPLRGDEIDQAIERARALAPHLLGRVLKCSHLYLDNLAMLKSALLDQGENSRSADLVAAIAAGRLLLTSDERLNAETAAEEAVFWRGLLASREESDMLSNPGGECLAHLLTWPSGKRSDDQIVTLGELVEGLVNGRASPDDISNSNRILGAHGLKVKSLVCDDGALRPFLLVAHRAPLLDRVFANTNFRAWRRVLVNLDALGTAHKTRKCDTEYFAMGLRGRSTGIPLERWLKTSALRTPSEP